MDARAMSNLLLLFLQNIVANFCTGLCYLGLCLIYCHRQRKDMDIAVRKPPVTEDQSVRNRVISQFAE